MEYTFNKEGSYTVPIRQFINIGTQGVKFNDKDLQEYLAHCLMHEHMHKIIEKTEGLKACVLYDLISDEIQNFTDPEADKMYVRNGFRSKTKTEILIYYSMNGLLKEV